MTQAVQQGNIGSIITFQNNVDWAITIGAAPLPTISANTTIVVPPSSNVTVLGTATAQNPYSIFTVPVNVTAEIDNLTIKGGYALNGGGVYNTGNLTLVSDVIEGNSATTDGGGIYNAYFTPSKPPKLSLVNVEVVDNDASNGNGGGLANYGGNVIICSNSEIDRNEANKGGGLYTTGLDSNFGKITFFTLPAFGGPSIYFNKATANMNGGGLGGGVYVDDGGIFTMFGGTIGAPGLGNRATNAGGGIYNYGDDNGNGTVTLVGVTVQNNKAGFGGGGMYLAQGSATTLLSVTVQNNKLNGGAGVGIYQQNGSNLIDIGLSDTDDPNGKPVKGP
jgi:predicted outer membrane repeat protein